MAKKKKKNRTGLRWLAAFLAAAALITALALLLTPKEKPSEPEKPVPSRMMAGIDVSSHQGQIHWQAVADSGVEFAMIRLGYRSIADGRLNIDPRAKENLEGARAAGLKVGGYFFSQAVSEAEARTEAAFALEILGDFSLDLPLAYDWEYVSEEARTAHVDGELLVRCVHAFCQSVEAGGLSPMVYFNQDLANTRLDLEQIQDYPFWLAKYADSLDFTHEISMWQYSDQGKVPGIEENVDLNRYWS